MLNLQHCNKGYKRGDQYQFRWCCDFHHMDMAVIYGRLKSMTANLGVGKIDETWYALKNTGHTITQIESFPDFKMALLSRDKREKFIKTKKSYIRLKEFINITCGNENPADQQPISYAMYHRTVSSEDKEKGIRLNREIRDIVSGLRSMWNTWVYDIQRNIKENLSLLLNEPAQNNVKSTNKWNWWSEKRSLVAVVAHFKKREWMLIAKIEHVWHKLEDNKWNRLTG